ncbi:MAG: S8 family serine peptidase, partial [Bacteroidia bacterium]|nr:S8 family serine peptidase [Bacteroidia bacterium]
MNHQTKLFLAYVLICLFTISSFSFVSAQCTDLVPGGGGTFDSHNGVEGTPSNAGGEADNNFTGVVSGGDWLQLTYPALQAEAEICVTVGFSNSNGKVELELNGDKTTFDNGTGDSTYAGQAFCLTVTDPGVQTIIIKDKGSGDIKIDGSVYSECMDELNLIDSLGADDPLKYIMLASKNLDLKDAVVSSGGLGIWSAGEEIKIDKDCAVSTFARAESIDDKSETGVSFAQVLSPSPAPDNQPPAYIDNNPSDLKIDKNQPDTTIIDGTDYKKLTVDKNNVVRFAETDTIYIEELEFKNANDGEEIHVLFSYRTVVIIEKKLNIGKFVYFNENQQDGVQVFVIDGDANIEENSSFRGMIDARQGKIDVKGKKNEPTIMVGQFIAEEIRSEKEVDWSLDIETPGNILPSYPPAPLDILPLGNIIGSELTSLFVADPEPVVENIVADNVYTLEVDTISGVETVTVFVEVVTIPKKYDLVVQALQGFNFEILSEYDHIIAGFIPVEYLDELNALGFGNDPCVQFARPVFRPILDAGIVTSQGDKAQRSDYVRNGFQIDGSGVKIGIISDSYDALRGNNAALDIQNGDLPAAGVQVLQDGGRLPNPTDEGRAMLQIVHDVAPGAELAFKTGFISAGGFAKSISDLDSTANCNIICDDITYITEPFYEDGIVAKAAEEVVANGVTYVSAAGNYGENTYSADFNGVPIPFGYRISGFAHDFNTNPHPDSVDILQEVKLEPGNYTISLHWEDDYYSNRLKNPKGADIDLDIYLIDDDNNKTIRYNRNFNNKNTDPIEIVDFSVQNATTYTNIMIVSEDSTDVNFKYIFFRYTGKNIIREYKSDQSTIVGQANSPNVIAVGAVLFKNTPEYGKEVPTPASFSSRGGFSVKGQNRTKPDICAPNGVNTTVDLGGRGEEIDGDEFPNFSGTSAAAPHAAGSIALIMEGRKKFMNKETPPDTVKRILIETALDMEDPGHDPSSGWGFNQPDKALLAIANPTPILDTYELPGGIDSTNIGDTPFDITINGQYLVDSTCVMFGDQALATNVLSDTVVTATIPTFNPLDSTIVSLFNPAITSSALDGGNSNGFAFINP